MELKPFQREIIGDLKLYLDLLDQMNNLSFAWEVFHSRKKNRDALNYQNTIEGVPHVCVKVPTGGGKTFIAASALKTIFDGIPQLDTRFVIWLVPSDSILEQTIRNLSNIEHPYRQKLEQDFNGNVQIFTKDEMLLGQNFSPSTVDSNSLSIGILSYSSLRIDSKKKDSRKIFQPNGNLQTFDEFGEENFLENTPESALIQIIRRFKPVVIVDESHNATSTLSVEMLSNLNPSFILDLTATPRKNSNILSIASPLELKNESMVKIPVIVYNRPSTEVVIEYAIALQKSLEEFAKSESQYIRPIVLFQAQPNMKSKESETFEKIREKLIAKKIPRDQIAIKTSNINEIAGIDLMSEKCPIRFIITVNALKEGWDCPFAYVLASIANRNSEIDVEQIVGRILRQPNATRCKNNALNCSYVFTSSDEFRATLEKIVNGLNNAGFSRNDCRVTDSEDQFEDQFEDQIEIQHEIPKIETQSEIESETQSEIPPESEIVEDKIEDQIENPVEDQTESEIEDQVEEIKTPINVEEIIRQADELNREFNSKPRIETRDNSRQIGIRPEFREEIEHFKLPQFTIQTPSLALFSSGDKLLQPTDLLREFSLESADAKIDLSFDANMYQIDLDKGGDGIPAYRLVSQDAKKFFVDYLKIPKDRRRSRFLGEVMKNLDRDDELGFNSIQNYVRRVIDSMDEDLIGKYEQIPWIFARKIRDKIISLKRDYCENRFYDLIGREMIHCEDQFEFPTSISLKMTKPIKRSLYELEQDDLNNFEREAVRALIEIPNVKWWHRNISRRGFCLNGFERHYPDFIIRLESGKTILLETKGDHLDGSDSQKKLKLGTKWANLSGEDFRYFMVFGKQSIDDSLTLDQFLNQIRSL